MNEIEKALASPGQGQAGHHHRPLRLGQERRSPSASRTSRTTRSTTCRCRCCASSSTTRSSWCAATTASPWSPTCAPPASPRSSRACSPRSTATASTPRLLFLESLGRGAGAALLGDPAPPPAGAGPAGDRGDPPRARGAGRAAGAGRHGVRHQRVVDPRDPQPGLPRVRQQSRRRARDGRLPGKLRFQARHPLRHRPAVRRAVSAQPALRSRACASRRGRTRGCGTIWTSSRTSRSWSTG